MEDEKKIICANCSSVFDKEYNFCPYCGQENRDLKLSFKHVVSDFLSGLFNVDNKLFVTLKLLLFKPAFLTREYVEGKRTKYISPVRLYLFISLVYFFIISFTTSSNIVDIGAKERGEADTAAMETVNNVTGLSVNDKSETLPYFLRVIVEKSRYIKTENGKRVFWDKFRKNVSAGMFLLMPVTALILMLLFYKNHYYLEHLILIIHLQSLWFLLFIVTILLNIMSGWDMFVLEMILLISVTVFWIKVYYRQKVFQAIWKTFIFFTFFTFVLFLFFVITILISVFLL
jgi:hypothetical protein